MILFGYNELSEKLAKAHSINNYLGFYGKSGKEIQGDEGLSDRDAWCKKGKMIIRSS